MKKYNIIYADPPWSYKNKMVMKGTHGNIRGAQSFYETMKLKDIKKINIPSGDNCILFLWVTMPLLQEGLDVIKAWGFEYKTCGFTWIKKTKNNKIHFGMGYYTRGNAELCLIGLKGKIEIINKSISQIIESPVQNHSRKPDEVRKRIVKLCGDLPRIELFARDRNELFNEYKGWDVWGSEVKSDIKIEVVK